MAITRRQFVTRLGALAAAVGMSQAEVSRVVEAFGQINPVLGATLGKPKVIWVHGAECTGCSTSVLGILENTDGNPLYGNSQTTLLDALGLAGFSGFTFPEALRLDGGAYSPGALNLINFADVAVDVIDLQYHETVMGMGGDLAAQWLDDFIANGGKKTVLDASGNPVVHTTPFPIDADGPMPYVLVVEGALQDVSNTDGAWTDTSTVPWCSIGMSDDGTVEHDMPHVVTQLAKMANCVAVVPIGQCACFGGYPGCKPSLASDPDFNVAKSQTGAKGVYDYLTGLTADPDAVNAAGKVINVPGCPTNPFWFVLTVVLLMADLENVLNGHGSGVGVLAGLEPNPAALDSAASRRLKAVYPIPVHSAWCPRFKYYNKGQYASTPGGTGCLRNLGCKGLYTRSLCGVHGWNNQQPQNAGAKVDTGVGGGGHCTSAGHPCMGCTEPGYPDRFVPFVKL